MHCSHPLCLRWPLTGPLIGSRETPPDSTLPRAVLPFGRVAPIVPHGIDDDVLGLDLVVDREREAAHPRPAGRLIHRCVELGRTLHLGEAGLDRTQELVPETWRLALIPAPSGCPLRPLVGGRGDASLLRPESVAHLLPRDRATGIIPVSRPPAGELLAVGLGQRKPLGLRGDAVPEVFDELNALREREPEELCPVRVRHARRVPKEFRTCNRDRPYSSTPSFSSPFPSVSSSLRGSSGGCRDDSS